mmetsp:Transcript_13768/g.44116  ORF Transcript_13768/g.44116 Transcript_13768/m.44116 type:complete len:328 (+) Transcript_13768:1164-2147(+)
MRRLLLDRLQHAVLAQLQAALPPHSEPPVLIVQETKNVREAQPEADLEHRLEHFGLLLQPSVLHAQVGVDGGEVDGGEARHREQEEGAAQQRAQLDAVREERVDHPEQRPVHDRRAVAESCAIHPARDAAEPRRPRGPRLWPRRSHPSDKLVEIQRPIAVRVIERRDVAESIVWAVDVEAPANQVRQRLSQLDTRESAVGWAPVHFVEEVADGQRRDSATARRERQPALQAGARRVLRRREGGRCGQCRRRQQQKQHGGGAIEAPSPLRVSAQVGRETHQRGNQREVAQQEQRSKLRPPVARRESGRLAQQRSPSFFQPTLGRMHPR